MSCSDSQKRATMKYLQEKTDDIRLRVRKGTKARWKYCADKAGKSMTAYVHDAVDRQIAFDECGQNELDPTLLPNLIGWLKSHGHSAEEIIDCIQTMCSTQGNAGRC